jgi:hypothetical protein
MAGIAAALNKVSLRIVVPLKLEWMAPAATFVRATREVASALLPISIVHG